MPLTPEEAEEKRKKFIEEVKAGLHPEWEFNRDGTLKFVGVTLIPDFEDKDYLNEDDED